MLVSKCIFIACNILMSKIIMVTYDLAIIAML